MVAKSKSNKPAPKELKPAKKVQPAKDVAKKPVAKKKPAAKKKVSKKVVQKKPTDQEMHNWFMKTSQAKFLRLTQEWNEENLRIQLPDLQDYDVALNHFKTLSPNQIKVLAETGLDIISTEAYAALSRWHDIISNPSRIDKIHRAGLTGAADSSKTIAALAEANDRYGVLKAIRAQLAAKLQNNPGNRDTSDLAKQMMEVMTQIADYEKRLAHTKDKTVLGELLKDIPKGGEIKSKRPARNGGGHRQTSFASRVTIKDVEKDGK